MNEQPAAEERIFLAAVDRQSAEERRAYLERACGGNAHLRRRVEALLAAHDKICRWQARPDVRQRRAALERRQRASRARLPLPPPAGLPAPPAAADE